MALTELELAICNQSPIMILCYRCKILKPSTEFHKKRDSKNGFNGLCKKCSAIQNKEYRIKNPAKVKERKNKYYQQNKNKCRERNKQWIENNREKFQSYLSEYNNNPINKERRKDLVMQKSYGITLIDYNEQFIIQDGKCAICETHQSELNKSLHIDHNHQTGKVRGLLCSKCNLIVGQIESFTKDPKKLIDYINNDGVR